MDSLNGLPPLHAHSGPQPLFPDLVYPSQNKLVRSSGQLSWLSSKAGVIQCATMNATVSFQLKDFVDNASRLDFVFVFGLTR